MTPRRLAAIALTALLLSVDVSAQAPAAIHYAVTFPDLGAHAAWVSAEFPTGGTPTIELMMAVWSPGYYKVEHYARNVDSVSATGAGGAPLAVRKTRDNRWLVETQGGPSVTVRYRVKADRQFVTADWVGDSLIVLCGAPTFMTPVDGQSLPADVAYAFPPGWTSATSLDSAADRASGHYVASDYDELVDSPVIAGRLETFPFTVAGKTHLLVDAGATDGFDGARGAAALDRIVKQAYRFWGELPYPRYVFLNVFRAGGGGLEHRNSTLLTVQARGLETPAGFDRWLTFVSHEYVHAFNVKRLRPVELGPFDYEAGPTTPSLWIAEGLTTYYGDLFVVRAGLAGRQDWLGWMSKLIADLQHTPGRKVQTLAQSSLDVWNSEASGVGMDQSKTVSYYTKGPVVGLLLDAHIRALTHDSVSLDDVMREAYARYGGVRGYTPAQFQATASRVAGYDLRPWFRRALDTTHELDYREMLNWFGLQFSDTAGPTSRWALEPVAHPTRAQAAHLAAILRPDASRGGEGEHHAVGVGPGRLPAGPHLAVAAAVPTAHHAAAHPAAHHAARGGLAAPLPAAAQVHDVARAVLHGAAQM